MEHNNGEIPTAQWFLRTGIWANREKKDWEETNNFNGNNFVSAINKFGGITKVRKLMNIESQNNRSKPHLSERAKERYKDNDEIKIKKLNSEGKNKPFDVRKIEDGEFIGTFTYQFQARDYLQKEYNKKNIDISAVLCGRQTTSKGFTFKYK
jgi:DNA-binding transcriptional regulator WhiA